MRSIRRKAVVERIHKIKNRISGIELEWLRFNGSLSHPLIVTPKNILTSYEIRSNLITVYGRFSG